MIYHRYPARSLMWDYCRAAAGLLIAGTPLLMGSPGVFFTLLFGTVAALFFFYGLRTVNQHMSALELREDGIMNHGPRKKFFGWDDLSDVRLRYYSTTRDKNRRSLDSGWMELRLAGPDGQLRIDSEISEFDTILDAVAGIIERRKLDLDETTEQNFKAYYGKEDADDGNGPGNGPGGGRDDGRNHPGGMC
jgi:hypothetical protein